MDAEIDWIICENYGIIVLLENKQEYYIDLESLRGIKRFNPLFEDKSKYKYEVDCDEEGIKWDSGVYIKNKEVPVLGERITRTVNNIPLTPIIGEFYDIEVRHDSWMDKKYGEAVIYFEYEDDCIVFGINSREFLELPDLQDEDKEFFIHIVVDWINLYYEELMKGFDGEEFYDGFFIKDNGEL